MLKRQPNEGETGIRLRLDQVFCLVESQVVIFDFEEAGDKNRACCHLPQKVYFLNYLFFGSYAL